MVVQKFGVNKVHHGLGKNGEYKKNILKNSC